MSETVYKKTAFTGGGATALDGIDGTGLLDSDMAFVTVSGVAYIYILDADDAGVEASPTRITPDANAGNKRWLLQNTYLIGMTASAAELNLNDGSVAGTAVASKALALGANKNVDTLAIADGGLKLGAGAGTAVTSTAAELNILDGVTATAAELNLIDGSAAGTAVASKAAVLGANKNLDTLVIADGGLKLGAGAGTAITPTAAELNFVDGVTSAIQTQLDAKNTITEITAASVLSLSNTGTVGWTDIDVTAQRTGSTAAKFAVLRVVMTTDWSDTGTTDLQVLFRKNGTTNTFASMKIGLGMASDNGEGQVIVPVDAGEVFEYSVAESNNAPSSNSLAVFIVGFIT